MDSTHPTQAKLDLLMKILTSFPTEALLASFPSLNEAIRCLDDNEQEGFDILMRNYPAFKAAITPFLPPQLRTEIQTEYCRGDCTTQESSNIQPFCVNMPMRSTTSSSNTPETTPSVTKYSSEISQSLSALRKRSEESGEKRKIEANNLLRTILRGLQSKINSSTDGTFTHQVAVNMDPFTQKHVTEPFLEVVENNNLKVRSEVLSTGQRQYTITL